MLFLEFLKILLSPQIVFGVVALTFLILFHKQIRSLFDRMASFKIGGAEFSAPQPVAEVENSNDVNAVDDLSLAEAQDPNLREALQAERARAHLWEYRYLNMFLVSKTQQVLAWLDKSTTNPTYTFYDAHWMPSIPQASERRSIMQALENHNLVVLENEVLNITAKGKEYIEWRHSQNLQS